MRVFAKGLLTAAATGFIAASPAYSAVIGNGQIFLGVNPDASLNTGDVRPDGRFGIGLYDGRSGWESTYPGCTCEGWGVANAADGTTGWANTDDGGSFNLDVTGFAVNGTFGATSVVQVLNGASSMQVVHDFAPSVSGDLYRVNVRITNTGTGTIDDLLYRRVMDWDIEPTAFNEYVTIQGVRDSLNNPHPNIRFSSDDGFASADPLAGPSSILFGTVNTNFTDSGPTDHGALFDFSFGSLGAGETRAFNIYYGAASSESNALASLNAVGAEIYSLAQAADSINGMPFVDGNPLTNDERSTFIFAFDIDNDGSSFANPILPTRVDENGGFVFAAIPVSPGSPIVIDPLIAIGYEYTSTAEILGVEWQFLGDSSYTVHVGGLSVDFSPLEGKVLNFADLGLDDIFAFSVDGIDESLMLDPTNQLAFKTKLFLEVDVPTLVDITQTPITKEIGAPVPEPASWAMMIGGFGIVGGAIRRRRVRTTVSFA